MLLFEFFPAFLALVSVLVAIVLFAADRRARSRGEQDPPIAQPRTLGPQDAPERGPGRPSMSA